MYSDIYTRSSLQLQFGLMYKRCKVWNDLETNIRMKEDEEYNEKKNNNNLRDLLK